MSEAQYHNLQCFFHEKQSAQYEWHPQHRFWDVQWVETPQSSSTAALLYLLIISNESRNLRVLITNHVQCVDLEKTLQTRLHFTKCRGQIEERSEDGKELSMEIYFSRYHCTFLEAVVQLGDIPNGVINTILDYWEPTLDLHKLLLLHSALLHKNCGTDCVLQHILKMGVKPDRKSSPINPLQIAVANLDFDATKLLLEAGAHVDGFCDIHVDYPWKEDEPMGAYEHVRGANALDIVRKFAPVSLIRVGRRAILLSSHEDAREKARITDLLLKFMPKSPLLELPG